MSRTKQKIEPHALLLIAYPQQTTVYFCDVISYFFFPNLLSLQKTQLIPQIYTRKFKQLILSSFYQFYSITSQKNNQQFGESIQLKVGSYDENRRLYIDKDQQLMQQPQVYFSIKSSLSVDQLKISAQTFDREGNLRRDFRLLGGEAAKKKLVTKKKRESSEKNKNDIAKNVYNRSNTVQRKSQNSSIESLDNNAESDGTPEIFKKYPHLTTDTPFVGMRTTTAAILPIKRTPITQNVQATQSIQANLVSNFEKNTTTTAAGAAGVIIETDADCLLTERNLKNKNDAQQSNANPNPNSSLESAPRNGEIASRNLESAPRNAESGPRSVESGPRNVESGPRNVESGSRNIESGPRNVEQAAARSIEPGSRGSDVDISPINNNPEEPKQLFVKRNASRARTDALSKHNVNDGTNHTSVDNPEKGLVHANTIGTLIKSASAGKIHMGRSIALSSTGILGISEQIQQPSEEKNSSPEGSTQGSKIQDVTSPNFMSKKVHGDKDKNENDDFFSLTRSSTQILHPSASLGNMMPVNTSIMIKNKTEKNNLSTILPPPIPQKLRERQFEIATTTRVHLFEGLPFVQYDQFLRQDPIMQNVIFRDLLKILIDKAKGLKNMITEKSKLSKYLVYKSHIGQDPMNM